MSEQQIGACPFCNAAIYAGAPRRGIWCYILPPRIERTCVCFDVLLYSIQFGLLHNSMMPSALALVLIREDEKKR